MAIAAAEPAPAAVITWARGSTTLPAAQTPGVLVRPVASTVAKPAVVEFAAEVGEQAVGVRDVARPDEHRGAWDHPAVGQLDAGQPVGVDHQPRDLAVDHPDAARLELARSTRSGRRCGRRRRHRRTTAGRAGRAAPRPGACRGRRGAGRAPPTRGSTGSAAGHGPTVRGRRGWSGSSSLTPVGEQDAAGRHACRWPDGRRTRARSRAPRSVDDLDAVAGDLGPAHGEEVRRRHAVAGRNPCMCAAGALRGRRHRSRRPGVGPGPGRARRSGRPHRHRSPRRRKSRASESAGPGRTRWGPPARARSPESGELGRVLEGQSLGAFGRPAGR